jgi:predicted NAD/FAD-dependent oxidoreductase
MLWDPLALAALNQPPAQAAAPLFARVLAEMFGSDPSAAAIALPTRPLHLMYAEPARRYIDAHGGHVATGATAKIRIAPDGQLSVHASGEAWDAAAVIAAVPWFALSELFEDPPPALTDTLTRARAMASSPIVTVNLWFDREVMTEPFIGLPGRVMQWVFDKRAVFGQDDHAASHLSLVSSGAEPVLRLENPELIAMAHTELLEALPAVRRARLTRATVIREPRATFSLAPGQPGRPQTATALRGLYLAGDWIETGLPATIESAVRSGHAAAHAILGNLVSG